jgi:hypothetical protein
MPLGVICGLRVAYVWLTGLLPESRWAFARHLTGLLPAFVPFLRVLGSYPIPPPLRRRGLLAKFWPHCASLDLDTGRKQSPTTASGQPRRRYSLLHSYPFGIGAAGHRRLHLLRLCSALRTAQQPLQPQPLCFRQFVSMSHPCNPWLSGKHAQVASAASMCGVKSAHVNRLLDRVPHW